MIIFYQKSSPYLAPVYAVLQGLILGGVSAAFEQEFGGIVLQTVMPTFGILLTMLMIYATGAIPPSDTFKLVLTAATGGIVFVYLMDDAMPLYSNASMIHNLKNNNRAVTQYRPQILSATALIRKSAGPDSSAAGCGRR